MFAKITLTTISKRFGVSNLTLSTSTKAACCPNIDFIENTLIIVNERSDGVYLEKVDVSPARVDTGATYLTHLDRKLVEFLGIRGFGVHLIAYVKQKNSYIKVYSFGRW